MAKIIGNTTTTPPPKPDWTQVDATKPDFIKNKPDLDIYATIEWVRQYVYNMLSVNYQVDENAYGGLTYNIISFRVSVEENESNGNTITITGGVEL